MAPLLIGRAPNQQSAKCNISRLFPNLNRVTHQQSTQFTKMISNPKIKTGAIWDSRTMSRIRVSIGKSSFQVARAPIKNIKISQCRYSIKVKRLTMIVGVIKLSRL